MPKKDSNEHLSPFYENIETLLENPFQRINFADRALIRMFQAYLATKYKIHYNGIENLEKLDTNEEAVIAFSHEEADDPFLGLEIMIRTGHRIFPISKKENFEKKGIKGFVYRWVMDVLNAMPIDREEPISDMMKLARYVKKSPNIWIALAPEGQRTLDGSLGEFKDGTNLVYRAGAEQFLPMNVTYTQSEHNRRRIAVVNFGEPYTPTHPKDVNPELRQKIEDLKTITTDHVLSVMFPLLIGNNVGDDFSGSYLIRAMDQLSQEPNLYNIFPTKPENIPNSVDDYLRMLCKSGFIQQNGIDVDRMNTSFADYMIMQTEVENWEDLPLEKIKEIGRDYKHYNPIGYLINQTPEKARKLIEEIVQTQLINNS